MFLSYPVSTSLLFIRLMTPSSWILIVIMTRHNNYRHLLLKCDMYFYILAKKKNVWKWWQLLLLLLYSMQSSNHIKCTFACTCACFDIIKHSALIALILFRANGLIIMFWYQKKKKLSQNYFSGFRLILEVPETRVPKLFSMSSARLKKTINKILLIHTCLLRTWHYVFGYGKSIWKIHWN